MDLKAMAKIDKSFLSKRINCLSFSIKTGLLDFGSKRLQQSTNLMNP